VTKIAELSPRPWKLCGTCEYTAVLDAENYEVATCKYRNHEDNATAIRDAVNAIARHAKLLEDVRLLRDRSTEADWYDKTISASDLDGILEEHTK